MVFPSLSEVSTVVIHMVKGFSIVNKAEVDVFLELPCFFDEPTDVDNLISGSSACSKSSLNIWNFTVLGESRTLANLQAAFRRAGLSGRLTALSPSALQGLTACPGIQTYSNDCANTLLKIQAEEKSLLFHRRHWANSIQRSSLSLNGICTIIL